MLDKILVLIALIGLYAFCGVVVGFVAEPDLIVVTVLMLALATHDFWITVFKNNKETELETGGSLEARPTGVSGKPLETAKELEADLEKSTRSRK
ncbi:MAG: hypothetical protein OEM91_12600 [Hyphomicrobiales bacterium]|nr:hypothetical protein [Hyphomicrobiales bacterium]